MSFWIIFSWVVVAIMTAINIFVFLKLKQSAEQMLQVAFPGSKNMADAMARMQQMMGPGGLNRGGFPNPRASRPGARLGFQKVSTSKTSKSDDQLKAAMSLLKNIQKKK